ncbi:MAG: magnesium transporter CorA family protein [Candidatus Pacebacteria bacterium]|nr:magnesium transporter CorA family protein [Candidatus Paceibacterota bacterium]MCF7862708.1 magnesium transporter CorA family protein [Candidatus Paceibacterota bacterium]
MSYTIHKLQEGRWIDIQEPNQDDIEFLKKEFPFIHPTNLEDSMERVTHSKMDITDKYLFLSETLPTGIEPAKKATNFEVSFFLTKDDVITITHQKTNIFTIEQSQEGEIADISLPETPGLLMYRFLEKIFEMSDHTIMRIARSIQRIDDTILSIKSPNIIRETAVLQRNIIYFITSLVTSAPHFNELEKKDITFNGISMKEYWGDIADKIFSQRDTLEDYHNLLKTLSKAHEMFINHRMNSIISVLTVFSVIFLPLNLIAGIYGMNLIHLPFAESSNGFFEIISFMLAVALGLFTFFKLRNWI